MPNAIGIRFTRAGRLHFYDPGEQDPQPGELVIVETPRGIEAARVVLSRQQIIEANVSETLKPIVRVAEPEDLRKMDSFKAREEEALRRCREKVERYGLAMKLVGAEYNFDGTRLVVSFTADSRVDFRELVRELASTFRTRIELRQIGVRDEAKQIGGLGRCGRALCCCSFLGEFEPVSIRMAKDQDLPLNPMKISGLCGRLLCCLSYENDFYCEAKKRLPQTGQQVQTVAGYGLVCGLSVMKESVKVELDSGVTSDFPCSEVTVTSEARVLPRAASGRRRRR